jgi:hypothetical protein
MEVAVLTLPAHHVFDLSFAATRVQRRALREVAGAAFGAVRVPGARRAVEDVERLRLAYRSGTSSDPDDTDEV